jgi:hypothetical protein
VLSLRNDGTSCLIGYVSTEGAPKDEKKKKEKKSSKQSMYIYTKKLSLFACFRLSPVFAYSDKGKKNGGFVSGITIKKYRTGEETNRK